MDELSLLLLAGVGLAAGIAVLLLADARPRMGLMACFPLILLGSTKFRQRASAAALSGSVDTQILFEIAVYGLVAIIALIAALRLRPRIQRPTLMEILLFSLAAFAVASTFWSAVPTITLVRSLQLCVLVWFSVVALRWLGSEGVRQGLTASLAVYVLLFSLIALTVPGAATVWSERRFGWFAVHPITCGTLAGLAVVLLLAEALFVPRERWTRFGRFPIVALMPILATVLVASWSRGPLFATLGACAALILRRGLRPWIVWVPVGLSLAVAGALLLAGAGNLIIRVAEQSAGSDNAVVRFLTRDQSFNYLSTLGGRTVLWGIISELFFQRPLTGWGYSASRGLLPSVMRWASYSHNALAQTLLDLGLIGTVLLWFAVLRSFFADFLKPRWTDTPQGSARAFVFGCLTMLILISVVSETFAGVPGYELLIVVVCVFVSGRTRVRSYAGRGAPRYERADAVVNA